MTQTAIISERAGVAQVDYRQTDAGWEWRAWEDAPEDWTDPAQRYQERGPWHGTFTSLDSARANARCRNQA